jgi:hypothetical protein
LALALILAILAPVLKEFHTVMLKLSARKRQFGHSIYFERPTTKGGNYGFSNV